MIGKHSSGIALASIAAMVALSACVSEALPRDEDDPADAPIGDARPDARDVVSIDTARGDAADALAPQEGGTSEASADASSEPAVDASLDMGGVDVADERPYDASDVATGTDASDAAPPGADVRVDANDTGAVSDANPAVDTVDTGTPPIDVSDVASPPSDANDASSATDASDGSDVSDASDGALDATSDAKDASDGGVVVFYTENFDTGLGGFSSPVTVCGTSATWSNVSGYAHASEPATEGVTRISSPSIVVPAGATNVTLRMSHKFDLEDGWDSAQLLIGTNGGVATLVTTFSSGGYTTMGGATDPATCNAPLQNQYPGWSGSRTEQVSTTTLGSVVGGNTVVITLRALSDTLMGGPGWDINWITLSATIP